MIDGDELEISSGLLDVLMGELAEDVWAAETARNGFQYGANIVVFSPVWEAVERTGNYPLGVWTDSLFLPEKMGTYMPKVGETDPGDKASKNGNFHAGSRLSILHWSDFAVVSRPDPKKPDDIYVLFLYKHDDGRYLVHRWQNGPAGKANMAKVAHVDDVTEDEITMLGFDPAEIPFDEGWLNRLEDAKIKAKDVPMTCFVLVGRGDLKDTWQGQTSSGRPLTRSVLNDRFWKPPIPVWAWEFQNPNSKEKWLKSPPDGKKVSWKVDGSHQWRRQHGLSQVIEGDRRTKPEYQNAVLMDDGTTVEVYVLPLTKTGKSPLDNAAYDVVRNGGYVLDFQGENYHSRRLAVSLRDWGIWNSKIAIRTMIRVIPPEHDDAAPTEGGVSTDLSRSKLTWQKGPSHVQIEAKLQDWQTQFRLMLNHGRELEDLLVIMSGASEALDMGDMTKDLDDLATELGSLYTRKVTRSVTVPDPTATKTGAGVGGRARKKRVSTVCPECYHKLPFPGHADGCSLKPAAKAKKAVEKGKHSHTGTADPSVLSGGTLGQVSDPAATKEEMQEVEVPAVSFCEVIAVDWSDLATGQGWEAVSWAPEEGESGTLRVAWGTDQVNPDRYPTLIQAHERLCETYGIAKDNLAARHEIDVALWNAMYRLLKGKFGHLAGQIDANTFPKDSTASKVREKADHPVMVIGMTLALYGIQDLERFAKPILSQVLGKALADS